MTTRELEEELMAKKVIVRFRRTDGFKPSRADEAGRPFFLKTPVDVSLAQGGKQVIRLGLFCDMPCLVVRSGWSKLIPPGTELEVEIENPLNSFTLAFGAGEVVARAYPLDCSNLEAEE